MLDFLVVSTRTKPNGAVQIYPKFKIYPPSKDLMTRGGDFYAVWDEDDKKWSTEEHVALRMIDRELNKFKSENKHIFGDHAQILYMWDSDSGMIDHWHRYCQKQSRDSFETLDETLVFANTPTKKENYSTKSLPYELKEGSIENWDKLIGTLYSPEERHKIEWSIGSIISGDSKELQKFVVFYGSAGTGKSTILNVIQMLFDGYYSVFDAKSLGMSSNSFALEPFKKNPLVAIQHDGDLSRIEDNTRLNSLVSHELMTVNEKFKSQYENRFKAFLFMGTNKPVKITDARSGIIRRLIDVKPSGDKLSQSEYKKVTRNVKFELGAIAYHCLKVYKKSPHAYDDYIPLDMMDATNDMYNFMVDNYHIFDAEDGTTLKAAWAMYQEFVEEAKVAFPLSKRVFKEELRNYFRDFEERHGSNRNYFSGFRRDKFESKTDNKPPEETRSWIELKEQESIFDYECIDCPAQLCTEDGTPMYKWDKVKTKLSSVNTSKLHYVKVPENHIVIDFDICDENGNKSLEMNLKEANKWPETYCETSKSGSGIHLHYIYDGDATKLSSIYDDKIEVKIFTGNSSLRRKLTVCNNKHIAHINSGLPLKIKKEKKKMINVEEVADEKRIRAIIKKCLRKEIHANTKPNIDFIKKILDDAYQSGKPYDVSDMYNDVVGFAYQSSNQASACIKIVHDMHFRSEDSFVSVVPQNTEIDILRKDEIPIVFYDVEVFPNLFLVCYKLQGRENPVIRMINPTPSQIESLLQYRLIGFNNRRYDNHMIWACMMGYKPEDIYQLSQDIIINGRGFIGQAYNASYTDIYDYLSAGLKMSLKKLEIMLGIHHQELGLPWDKPVPEHLWETVAVYCDNDVIATEAVFDYSQADFTARKILADLAGMSLNDTTNTLTTRFIFGDCKKPQGEFYYRNLAKPVYESDYDPESIAFLKEVFPEMMAEPHGEAKSLLPYFEGYVFENGKSLYLGEEVGEGGYAKGNPNYWVNVALLDIASMHPHSTLAEVLFGPRFTKSYYQIVYGRVHIKHKAWGIVDGFLDGRLKPYIEKVKAGEMSHKDLANALKTAINSVYGLTAAHFDNAFHDPRNVDNIVAKRGALFMMTLKKKLLDMGWQVAHIKTDSIKIPNATPEIIKFVYEFGKRYGYTFEHECTYEKMVLVNDAVYIAKYATAENCEKMYGYIPGDNEEHGGQWTATGTQFAVPFVFKKLFSKEEVVYEDLVQTFSVSKGDLYLDHDEKMDVEKRLLLEKELDKLLKFTKKTGEDVSERVNELKLDISELHDLKFVGRVGAFVPIKSGYDAGVLYRVADEKLSAASGTTGYRWLESETVKEKHLEDVIDYTFFQELADKAREAIDQYVDYEIFANQDVPPVDISTCCGDCTRCGHFRRIKNAVDCFMITTDATLTQKIYDTLNEYCNGTEMTTIPF